MLEKFFSEPKTLLEAIEAVVPPSLREGKFRPPDKLPPTVGSNPMMLIAYRPSQTPTWTGWTATSRRRFIELLLRAENRILRHLEDAELNHGFGGNLDLLFR